AARDQPTAVKQFPRGACRGQRQLGSSLLEVFEDLHRSPARVGASDPNDGRLDVGRRAPRAVLRLPAPVFHPWPALLVRSAQPLVAGLTADAEAITELR